METNLNNFENQEQTFNPGDFLYVKVSERKKFQDKKNRSGFEKTMFQKSDYVTVTLTDHSEGHGMVKSVILRNPAPEFIAQIRDPKMWEISKETVTLITEEGSQVERTFRIVLMVTPFKKVLMSNSLEEQIRNLARNAYVMVDGRQEKFISYINSSGDTIFVGDERELSPMEAE